MKKNITAVIGYQYPSGNIEFYAKGNTFIEELRLGLTEHYDKDWKARTLVQSQAWQIADLSYYTKNDDYDYYILWFNSAWHYRQAGETSWQLLAQHEPIEIEHL